MEYLWVSVQSFQLVRKIWILFDSRFLPLLTNAITWLIRFSYQEMQVTIKTNFFYAPNNFQLDWSCCVCLKVCLCSKILSTDTKFWRWLNVTFDVDNSQDWFPFVFSLCFCLISFSSGSGCWHQAKPGPLVNHWDCLRIASFFSSADTVNQEVFSIRI